MNDIRQEIAAIYEARKIKRCAAAMAVAESTAYRYQQPLNRNGEMIPLANLMALNGLVSDGASIDALKAAYRLAQIINRPLGAVVVDRRVLQACVDSLPFDALHVGKEIVEICQHCAEPVQYLPICSVRCRMSRR